MKKSFSWKYFPYLLLLAYVVFVSYSFMTLYNRLDTIIKHPVHVLQYARDINTRLGEMQHTLPGLLATPEMTYDSLVQILKRQEDMQDESFNKIKEIFLGSPHLLTNLENAFIKIRELRRDAAKELVGNDDYNRSMAVYKKMIAPQVEVVHAATEGIIMSAQNLLETKKEQTKQDAIMNIAIAIIVGIVTAMAFIFVSRQESRKTKQLEDRDRLFNQLSENVDEIFIMAASEHLFDYVTTNSSRLINMDAAAILADPEKFYSFLPHDDAMWLKDMLDGPMRPDVPQQHTVIVDNGDRVFRLSIYPIKDGKEHRAIIALQDRTNDFKQRQALSMALENAHAASIAKSSFLSHMSHEIRTPMNAIIGMTTIALSKINNVERVEDCLGKIAESSRHLLRLINDVLDMSKIENGKLSINQEPFDLPTNIRNINDLVRPQAEGRKLNFEIFQENVDEEELVGDPLRLNQVLLNILSNALKFTPAGGTITLKIRQVAKKRNNVRIAFTISDTGIGMSKEFLERLYTPFEQANAATTARYGGTGLGMSITFNLVTLMGGTINVESSEGRGTTFNVELPFTCKERKGDREDTLPRLKVLVVDDDYGTCEHATLILEKMGMNVTWCTSGHEAIDFVREAHDGGAPYEVCLIDWKMPGMDGAETSRRIRQVAGDDVLIIIISAYDWSPIEEQARAAGVNDFIEKPFFASTLHNALLSTTQRFGMASASDRPKGEENYDFTGKRIMLVEDNEFNREIGEEFLDMVNATVVNAENGKEAVDKFLAEPAGYFDLILMDVQMPIMDGYEATKLIRQSDHPDAKDIHILAMTANAFSEDVAKAVASGMNGHIAKPIDVKDLYRQIRVHISQSEMRKASKN